MSAAAATGYRSRGYANALRHLGDVLPLPSSGGWLLAADVPGHTERDGRGPYPLFLCERWHGLADDLASLDGLVSVTLVVDPLAPMSRRELEAVFDVVRPFKAHHLVDVSGPPTAPSRHHARKLRVARRHVAVEVVDPSTAADDWVRLYGHLVARHAVSGFADMPEESLRAQLLVPGCTAVRAVRGGRTVSMALWYHHGDAAHLHLAASDEVGYATGAAYAVTAASIEHLATTVQVIDLGGVAGMVDDPADGLARFKAGWSSGVATAHLCGAVIDRTAFDRLTTGRAAITPYFPPYRVPA